MTLEDDGELETPMVLFDTQQGFGEFVQEKTKCPFYWPLYVKGLDIRAQLRQVDEFMHLAEEYDID